MMDPACATPEEGAGSGEQQEDRPKRPGIEMELGRFSVKPKRQREEKWERRKGKRQTRQGSENALHIVLHLRTTAPASNKSSRSRSNADPPIPGSTLS